jgi:hypothetical protein
MAQTHNATVKPLAQEAKAIADLWKTLHYRAKQFLDTNSDASINWAGDPKPAVINEDGSGNIDGVNFSRTQLANFIGSLDNLRKVADNEQASQGDHLGNVNQLADANP